jgi:hypothetical protein
MKELRRANRRATLWRVAIVLASVALYFLMMSGSGRH